MVNCPLVLFYGYKTSDIPGHSLCICFLYVLALCMQFIKNNRLTGEATDVDGIAWKCFAHYWPLMRVIHHHCWISLTKGHVMSSFDVLFVGNLQKLLNKQQSCQH